MPLPEWHPPFSSFSSFWGAKPLFSVGRMQVRHFRRFRQSGPFLTGDKNTVYQKHGLCHPENQKNSRVRKIFVRNSGAGNGCANFMDAWKNASVLQEKFMSIKFLVLGGGSILGFGGRGKCRFYSDGREDFSEKKGFSSGTWNDSRESGHLRNFCVYDDVFCRHYEAFVSAC